MWETGRRTDLKAEQEFWFGHHKFEMTNKPQSGDKANHRRKIGFMFYKGDPYIPMFNVVKI
jgi:hypothetical protein